MSDIAIYRPLTDLLPCDFAEYKVTLPNTRSLIASPTSAASITMQKRTAIRTVMRPSIEDTIATQTTPAIEANPIKTRGQKRRLASTAGRSSGL
jgi:hypothetical protein